jgi:hypothetical protein
MRALRCARHAALALLLLAALGPQTTAARRTPALRPTGANAGAGAGQVVLVEPAGGGGARGGGGAAWTFPVNAASAPAPAASAQPDLSQLIAQFTAEQAAAATAATAPPAAPSASGGTAALPLGVKPSGRPVDDANLLEMMFAAAPGPLPSPAPAPATRPAVQAAVQPAVQPHAVAQGPAPLAHGGARARSGAPPVAWRTSAAAPALLRLKAMMSRGGMEGGAAQQSRVATPLIPTAPPPMPATRQASAPAPGPVAALEVEELVDTVLLAGLAAAELAAQAPLPSAAPPAVTTVAAPAPVAAQRVLTPRQTRKRVSTG